MRSLFRRPKKDERPPAAEILATCISARDFNSAAIILLAGAAEIIDEARGEAQRSSLLGEYDQRERVLRLALARVIYGS